jgi:hypothetical protein
MALDTQHPLLHHPKNPILGFFKWGEPHPKVVVLHRVRFLSFPPTCFFQKKPFTSLFYLPIPLLLPIPPTPFSMSRIYHCQVPLCSFVLVSFHFVHVNVCVGLLKKRCACERVGTKLEQS